MVVAVGSYPASITASPPMSPKTLVSKPRSIESSSCSTLPIGTLDSYLGDRYPSSETEFESETVQTLATSGSNRPHQKRRGTIGGHGRCGECGTRNSTRKGSGKAGSLASLEHSNDDDSIAMQSLKFEERRSSTLPNERKPRWLWSTPSTVSQPPPPSSLEKTSTRAFDVENPILRSLVLISPPSRSATKISRHQHGSSKSLTAPIQRLESESSNRHHQQQQDQQNFHDQQQYHTLSLPPSPIHLSANNSIQSSNPRVRSTSVSKSDDTLRHGAFQGIQPHQQQQQLNSHLQPSVGDILASQQLCSQPSLSTQSSQRCTDPALVTGFPFETLPYLPRHQLIISRHIVAPVDLAKAIEKEGEAERERQLEENVDKTVKTTTTTTLIPTETEEAVISSSLRSSSKIRPVVPRRSPFRSAPIAVIDSSSCLGNTTSTFPL